MRDFLKKDMLELLELKYCHPYSANYFPQIAYSITIQKLKRDLVKKWGSGCLFSAHSFQHLLFVYIYFINSLSDWIKFTHSENAKERDFKEGSAWRHFLNEPNPRSVIPSQLLKKLFFEFFWFLYKVKLRRIFCKLVWLWRPSVKSFSPASVISAHLFNSTT